MLVKKPKVTKSLDAVNLLVTTLYPRKVNMHPVKVMVSKVRISLFLVSFTGFHVQLQKGWEGMSICGDARWLSQSLVMIRFAWSIIHINVLFKFDPKIPKFWFSMEKSCQGWPEMCKLFNLRNITQNQRSGGYTWRALVLSHPATATAEDLRVVGSGQPGKMLGSRHISLRGQWLTYGGCDDVDVAAFLYGSRKRI